MSETSPSGSFFAGSSWSTPGASNRRCFPILAVLLPAGICHIVAASRSLFRTVKAISSGFVVGDPLLFVRFPGFALLVRAAVRTKSTAHALLETRMEVSNYRMFVLQKQLIVPPCAGKPPWPLLTIKRTPVRSIGPQRPGQPLGRNCRFPRPE